MHSIQFTHANGIPAAAYKEFFDKLEAKSISHIDWLGAHNSKPTSWWQLADELIADIKTKHKEPVIGMGHSIGAVLTYFAALQAPELFSKIVLIDPPIFSRGVRAAMFIANLIGQKGNIIPPAKKAKQRKWHFESKDAAYNYWKPKPLFAHFTELSFQNYISAALKPSVNGGFELTIPRMTEYNLFVKTPSFLPKNTLQVPSYCIIAQQYGVLNASAQNQLKKYLNSTQFLNFDGGHLFPFEKPQLAAQMINTLIS